MKTIIFRFVLCALFTSFILSTAAQNCTIVDKPDMSFSDVNNDGIDGDTAKAIFVSVTGNDMNSGKIHAPLATLEKAMEVAAASSVRDIYVSKGIYTLTKTLMVENGVSLYGLYDAQSSWQRGITNKVVINGPQNVLSFKNNTLSSTLNGFEINASDATAPGSSSQAITISNCTGLIMLTGNTVKSGKGADGLPGAAGGKGNDGGNGGDGGNGLCDGNTPGSEGAMGISSCGLNGGKGGSGGVHNNNGGPGQSGSSGATGGTGGNWGDPGKAGIKGTDGINGIPGIRGAASGAQYLVNTDGYSPSDGQNGTDGTHGTGGGGGGGGGGQSCTFCDDGTGNGGGGGGAAGCKGAGGSAGKGGGASIGVYIFNSKAYLENNIIATKAGGNGGRGGDGGQGGLGGLPGKGGVACIGEVGAGGDGGKGGNGGHGAGASGGNGGPSTGISIDAGSTVSGVLNTYTTGFGGSGGSGGTTPGGGMSGETGNPGLSETVHGTISPEKPHTFGELCIEDFKASRPHSQTRQGLVKVFLSEPSPEIVRVAYTYTQGTAIESTDFQFTNDTLEFMPYVTSASIPFDIMANLAETSAKSFTITLSGPDGASIARATANITIEPFNVQSVQELENVYEFNQWPNPFGGTGHIDFTAPVSSEIKIDLYDVMGKKVGTLHEGVSDGTLKTIEVSSSNLTKGVYFYTFSVNNNAIACRKWILAD